MKRLNKISSATDVGNVRSINEDSRLVNPDRMCFAVADGIGGAPYGEIASAIATQAVHTASKRRLSASDTVKLAFRMTGAQLAKKDSTKYHGMGTTLVVLCFDGTKATWGWVGDSRLYARRCGRPVLLTKDHHDTHGRLTRAMCTDISFVPSMGSITTAPGDVFVLCTDGVSNELTMEQIVRYGAQYTAASVVRKAVDAGGRDNATAVVVKL